MVYSESFVSYVYVTKDPRIVYSRKKDPILDIIYNSIVPVILNQSKGILPVPDHSSYVSGKILESL